MFHDTPTRNSLFTEPNPRSPRPANPPYVFVKPKPKIYAPTP